MDSLVTAALDELRSFSLRLMPLYLASTLVIAYAVYVYRHRSLAPGRFFRWIFPAAIYLHPSHWVDVKLFLFGRVLAVAGLINAVAVRTLATVGTMTGLGSLLGLEVQSREWSAGEILFTTLLFAVVGDFCTYWVHRLHHEYPVLWPFHAVHHSAEVMTPVTVYRKHPVYDLISDMVGGLAIGIALGAVLLVFSTNANIINIGGANIIFVAFNAVGANLRHSHIWISYGRRLEHFFISPAQHQIHHSRAVKHHDRNYGEIFAIWDWMFGTLYVPEGREALEFGLADRDGRPIEQPHGSLSAALAGPLVESWRAARARFARPVPRRPAA